MARAAAALHMAGSVMGAASAESGDDAQDGERMRQLLRSQAAGLINRTSNSESRIPALP